MDPHGVLVVLVLDLLGLRFLGFLLVLALLLRLGLLGVLPVARGGFPLGGQARHGLGRASAAAHEVVRRLVVVVLILIALHIVVVLASAEAIDGLPRARATSRRAGVVVVVVVVVIHLVEHASRAASSSAVRDGRRVILVTIGVMNVVHGLHGRGAARSARHPADLAAWCARADQCVSQIEKGEWQRQLAI